MTVSVMVAADQSKFSGGEMSGPYGPNNPDDQWSRDQGKPEGNAAETEQWGQPGSAGQPSSSGEYPAQGQYPQQQYGQGQYPQGQYPGQQGQPGPYPAQGQYPGQQGQQGQGQYPQQQYGQGQYPQGQYPQGQYPQGQYPQGQYPGAAGQYPTQGQFPQGQYPGQPGQYAAPGQQPPWNQTGQYPQGSAPGNQWGQGQDSPTGGKSKTPFIIGGAALAVVVVVLVVVFGFGLGRSTNLDQAAAEAGVEEIVTGTYGASSVSDVSCPSGKSIEKGASFDCSLQVDGIARTVTLTFTDDDGTYEVSRPR